MPTPPTQPAPPTDADALESRLSAQALAAFRRSTLASLTGKAGKPTAPVQEWHRRGSFVPHRENMAFQSITHRLSDSLPKAVVEQMKALLPSIRSECETRAAAVLRVKIERFEDAGYGACHLRDPRVAGVVVDNLLHFDGNRYRLHAYCIMPNHVHVLLELGSGWTLSRILHGWRSYTAKEANRILGRSGRFWMEEYFDRWIRNERHLAAEVAYILGNPVKAGLVDNADAWRWSGPRTGVG